MTPDVFSHIRLACARVAETSRWVRIDEDRVLSFAAELAAAPTVPIALDPAHHVLGDPGETLAYIVTLDAINFGSGWFPVLRKRDGMSGYFTVATALKEQFETHGPWSAADLGALGADDCARVFGQDPAGEGALLMAHFATALGDLGRLLARRFDSSFERLVGAAECSAARLVEILAEMPLYRDVAMHAGLAVPFYKRAQLTAADLSVAFEGSGPGCFDDLAELTIFADNLVPHVLRREGVLVYAPDLAKRIDEERPLVAGAEEEIEIRANAVHAVERCVAAMRAEGASVTAHELDYRLWNRGQLPEMKAHPRHRARTVYY